MTEQPYAHSVDGHDKSDWETLEEHSIRVSHAAMMRAAFFGFSEAVAAAEVLGLLHDLGKSKPAFQRRLDGSNEVVSHSGEGALILSQTHKFGEVLAGAIAGHHGRLPNSDHLVQRLHETCEIPLPDWMTLPDLQIPVRLMQEKGTTDPWFRTQFLTRMLYSCLVDADDTETGKFYDEVAGLAEVKYKSTLTREHIDRFDRYMAGIQGTGELNDLRSDVLNHVRKQACHARGFFSLTVPTGGGKTLTSLGFGLDHAAEHELRRLVYVIPFTSIVEQTAGVFSDVLGDDSVLEHHSAFDWDSIDESEVEQRRIASSNWDQPVIVTTAVQFFESLFSARKKRCRKLHNLAQSVIVIDEAQMLPRSFLRPCLAALHELVEGYGASVVLCTATQPSLTREAKFPAPEALHNMVELAPDPPALYTRLRRVRVKNIGLQTDEDLINRMCETNQVLLIVDNRLQARRLYDQIKLVDGAMHLSTLMTARHRREVLAKVRSRLHDGADVRLISTSLIEAGVDVDFPLVMRSATGIDSLAQAAGRCNREGKLKHMGEMLVFNTSDAIPPLIESAATIGREVLTRHSDPLTLEAVSDYFSLLWRNYGKDGLDVAVVEGVEGGILKAIADGMLRCQYEDIEKAFSLINTAPHTLIIRGDEFGVCQDELERLRWAHCHTAARALQAYTITVPYRVWEDLWAAGVVSWWEPTKFGEQFAILESDQYYDPLAGLAVDGFDDLGALLA